MKNFPLRLKLTFAFFLLATPLLGVSYYQIRAISQFNSLTLDLIGTNLTRFSALQAVQISSSMLRDQQALFLQSPKDSALKNGLIVQLNDLQDKSRSYLTLLAEDNAGVDQGTTTEIAKATSDIANTVTLLSNDPASIPLRDKLRIDQTQLDQTFSRASYEEQQDLFSSSDGINSTISRLLKLVVVAAGSATLLALLLGTIIASRISASMTRLRKSAIRMANGDFSRTIEVTTGDEIGQLGLAFNAMAERLRNSYRRLALEQKRDESILQSMSEGLVTIDENGTVSLMNGVAASLIGLKGVNDALGHNIQDTYKLYPADAPDSQTEPVPVAERPGIVAVKTGEESSGTYLFRSPDHKKTLLYVSASPIFFNNKIVGAVIILRDVTKEREIDRMKTEFISLASHQLRTPLSAIKWFTEMLVSGDAGALQADQMEFAKNIADSTERMIALVNALLNISRIESGRIMIDPKPTDLKELVTSIVNDLKPKIDAKQQTLIISVYQDLPKINLDPRLIEQVYLNLLTNAIKYTPAGGEISVFISKKDDQVVSQVSDNGYGIPVAQQGRIFEKFFRAANAVKVETDGTGLGLYLIKAVVESSGGKIWFKSEEGKGTTFWFSIPLSGMKAKQGEVTLDT